MIGAPKVENRDEQHYVGIRTQVPMRKMGKVIPELHGEVFAWLEQQGVEPVGAPFVRFHVIDMAALMDIEMGVPVANALEGEGQVTAGVLPAGRYASLVYTGLKNGIKRECCAVGVGSQAGSRMG